MSEPNERYREDILNSDHTWKEGSEEGRVEGHHYTCIKCQLFIDSCKNNGWYWDEDIQGWKSIKTEGIPTCSELCMEMALE